MEKVAHIVHVQFQIMYPHQLQFGPYSWTLKRARFYITNYKAYSHFSDQTTYYHLPMDTIRDQTLVNPSGLDAKVIGYPEMFPGVVNRAMKIDGRTQKIVVSGPGHREECFGNLKLCRRGKSFLR